MAENIELSLVIIAKNEQTNIERCIRSVPFARDIVVVDSYSTDSTAEIATKLGARVVQQEWLGFGKQKQFATDLAKYDWVLSLDADECLSSELAQEILSSWSSLDVQTAYAFPRRSKHLGQWISHGGWYPDYQTRLYNKKHCQWDQAEIHERLLYDKRKVLKSDLQHFVFADLAHQVETNNRYSGLQAQQLRKTSKSFSMFKLITKPVSKFLECYIWKKGFLDGMPGFIIAVGAAYSVFLKWAKLWEIEHNGKS